MFHFSGRLLRSSGSWARISGLRWRQRSHPCGHHLHHLLWHRVRNRLRSCRLSWRRRLRQSSWLQYNKTKVINRNGCTSSVLFQAWYDFLRKCSVFTLCFLLELQSEWVTVTVMSNISLRKHVQLFTSGGHRRDISAKVHSTTRQRRLQTTASDVLSWCNPNIRVGRKSQKHCPFIQPNHSNMFRQADRIAIHRHEWRQLQPARREWRHHWVRGCRSAANTQRVVCGGVVASLTQGDALFRFSSHSNAFKLWRTFSVLFFAARLRHTSTATDDDVGHRRALVHVICYPQIHRVFHGTASIRFQELLNAELSACCNATVVLVESGELHLELARDDRSTPVLVWTAAVGASLVCVAVLLVVVVVLARRCRCAHKGDKEIYGMKEWS